MRAANYSLNLTDPIFTDEDAARAHLEAIRWPEGPTCPHCGNADSDTITRLQGKSHRKGLYQCNACREHFTVTVGGVMEKSHIPLNKWVLAFHLMAASKKGISAHQLWRMLGFGSYRTAWFMAHRIREAMRDGDLSPLGGEGKIVEADETYYGPNERAKRRNAMNKGKRGSRKLAGPAGKRPIVALVERGGSVRTFHVEGIDKAAINKIVSENIARESRLHTDESKLYGDARDMFAAHETVKHSDGEYARKEYEWNADDTEATVRSVHINTAEGYFGVFKKGMRGVYQHCDEKHLHRYLAEFDFRFNNRSAVGVEDGERAARAMKGAEGKRLMYRQPH
jgi:transposase-like protein